MAVEIRENDADFEWEVAFLDDAAARATTECERALLRTLGGGCQVPIGAHAELDGSSLRLTAVVARPDGSSLFRENQSGRDPESLGTAVGEALLKRGARAILDEVYGRQAAVPQQP
jgi:hydroxymethylbilane synthase